MNEERDILHSFQGRHRFDAPRGLPVLPGELLARGQQNEIFRHLAGIGVDYVEVGNPAKPESGR